MGSTCDLVAIRYLVASVLNATRNGYGDFSTKVDPLHPQGEIDEAIKAASRQIMAVIFDTIDHRYRTNILTLKTVTDGQEDAFPVGAVLIDGKFGTLIKPSRLRRYKLNRSNLTTIAQGGYYCVEGRIISFIGSVCQVETLKDIVDSDLLVPSEYEMAVVEGALSIIFTKMGTNVAAANHHGNLYVQMLKLIREGVSSISAETAHGAKV